MYNGKLFVLFIVWYCATTGDGSPISIGRKCVGNCKTTIKNELHDIEGHQKNRTQTVNSNIVLVKPNEPGHLEPLALRRKRQLLDTSDTSSTTLLEEEVRDSVGNVTAQLDDKQSAELPLPSETSITIKKDESEIMNSIEYEKAQENLLSASQRVKDAESLPEGSLNNENLSDNNQPPSKSLDLKDFLKSNDSSDTISFSNMSQFSDALMTDISKGSTETQSVSVDDDVESDSSNNLKAPVFSEEPAGKKLEIDDTAIVTTAADKDDRDDEGDTSTTTYAPENEEGLNETPSNSNDKVDEQTSIAEKPQISDEAIEITLNEGKTNGGDGLGETVTDVIANFGATVVLNESTELKLNAADEMRLLSENEAKGETFFNAVDTSNLDNKIESVVNIPTDLKLTNPYSRNHHTTSKPETMPEAFVVKTTNTTHTIDTTSASKVNRPVVLIALDTAETQDASEKLKETLTNSNTSTEPINLPDLDSTTDTPMEMFPESGETSADDQIYFVDQDRHEIDTYNVDDSDEYRIEQHPFEEEFIGEPCRYDCEHTGERENNLLNSFSSESDQEYSAQYDSMMENHEYHHDNIGYNPHAYDNSRHFGFSDDFDSENEMEELFDSDFEFNNQNRDDFAHEHTLLCQDDDEDEFDDD